MNQIKHDQVKPVIIYLWSHCSKFRVNKQAISVVLRAPRMPAEHEHKLVKQKLLANPKRQTILVTAMHKKEMHSTWHLIHGQAT